MYNQNKKGAAKIDQSKEQPQKLNVNSIQNYYTPKNQKMQANKILSLIGYGQSNAIHLSELIELTGGVNRLIRKEIERLRRAGYVIVSDEKGYYFPETARELSNYIKRTERQAKSIFFTLRSARRKYKQLENNNEVQMSVDEMIVEKGRGN